MRAFKIVSLLIIAALLLASCAPPAPETLKVAILAPLSGPVPTFGVSTRDGALLAIEEWNAKGGVLGKQIVPIVEDSQCTPDPAVHAANKVIDQDKVKFIIGEVCSKASIPVSEIANAKGVVQISPTSTNPAVTVDPTTGKTKDYIFRACFIDPIQGMVGANYAYNVLGAKTAFVLIDQANDYVKGLAENFIASFEEAGGTIVGNESYTATDTDFSAILAKVADANPDLVYLPDYYNIVNLVMKQAKERGITTQFMGGDGWDSPDLDFVAADNGYFTNHYAPDSPSPTVQAFVKLYGEKYKDEAGNPLVPDALATLAYDATSLLLKAIETAGTDDPAVVKDTIATFSYDAVSGTIKYDESHNPVKDVTIVYVTGGKPIFKGIVTPEEYLK